ncbi:MFS transporter [Patescibacteria group bacterium]|nr:MFS transporter [Patescibacteria group bacterium]
MNLASRVRSFFFNHPKKIWLMVLTILVTVALTHVTPAFAQQAAGATTAAPVSSSAFDAITNASSGMTSCGGTGAFTNTGSCLLQVVGFVITFIFSTIAYFLSKLLVVLTSILITFAKYNKFNNAPPVEIGWVIVRDLCNMAFIIVLLISAFATIIGFDKNLHYSHVIPKLMVAAVLVNFSRTIVLLCIDASQVVMLTFISAFQGSIAGNLIQGLGINQMMQFPADATAGATAISLINICIAYILAIFLLLTAVTIVLIYVGYFIVRIVGLWILIIASPFAFLKSALPGSIGGMAKSKKDYWSQLTAYLTGGPIIAFWLWLTFAVIQQTAATGGMAGANMGFDFPADSIPGFITQIGTAPQLASFIVAVVMLGAGLEATQSAVGALDSKVLSDFAKKAVGYRDTAFKYMAGSPYYGARAVGRGAVKTGKFAFNAADRKWNMTGQIGQGMARGRAGLGQDPSSWQKAGGLLGDAARLIPGVGGVLATNASGSLTARRGTMMGEQTKKIEEAMGKLDRLPPEERVRALAQMREGGFDDTIMGPMLLQKQHDELTKDDNRKVRIKQLEKEAKAGIEADAIASKTILGAGEADRRASAIASQKILDEERERINALKEYAKTTKDSVAEEKLKKETEKKMLYDKPEDYDKRVGELMKAENIDKLKELDSSIFTSGRFAYATMRQAGAIGADGKVDQMRLSKLKEMEGIKDQKALLSSIDVVASKLDGGGVSVSQIESGIIAKDHYGTTQLLSTTGHGGTLLSNKEETALAALQAGGAGGIRGALDAGVGIKQIQQLVDAVDGAGATVTELAELSKEAVHKMEKGKYVNDQATALKRVDELLQAADALKAGTEDMAKIIDNAMGAVTDSKGNLVSVGAERLFAGSQTKDGQQRRLNIVRTVVRGEDENEAIKHAAEYLRKNVYPADKIEVQSERFTETQVEVEEKDGNGKVIFEDVIGTDGRPVEVYNRVTETFERKQQPKMKKDTVRKYETETRSTPSAFRNVLYKEG